MNVTGNNEKEHNLQVAKTIYNQMKMYAHEANCIDVLWSWGWQKHTAVELDGMPCLAFTVHGFNHNGKGRTMEKASGKSKLVEKSVYFDMLVDVIDNAVETGGMTADEYREKCLNAKYKIG